MNRRKFLVTSAAVTAFGSDLMASPHLHTGEKEGFLVKSGQARNGKHTPFRGINPNDLKISTLDTAGQMSVFEYIGFEKTGPALHVHLEQDEVFYVVEGEYLFQLGEKKHLLSAGAVSYTHLTLPTNREV